MGKSLAITLAAAALLQLTSWGRAPADGARHPVTKPVGWGPLTSRQAAKRVHRSGWEPRPDNHAANQTVPARAQLRRWQRRSEMPYAGHVNGRFRGTTDEIIQWSAYKWGFRAGVLRAVAAVGVLVASVGGRGQRRFVRALPGSPAISLLGECRIARDSTAFNADYYGGILRAYFDGRMKWLNTVDRGREYRPGDLWGSVGAWFAGRWWTEPARAYIHSVRDRLQQRVWADPGF